MKLFSLVDLIIVLMIGFHVLFDLFSLVLVTTVTLYITGKGAFFSLLKDVASVVDLIFGVYLILMLYGIVSLPALTVVVFIWFIQKSLFGLF